MSVLSIGAARAAVITVAAASALALLALPSAAHAAEVVTCTQQVTPLSQPWLTFSQSENFYADYALALDVYYDEAIDLTNAVPEEFDETDLDEYEEGLVEASTTLEATLEALATDNGLAVLLEQLQAVDPDDTTEWDEHLSTLFADFFTSTDEAAYDAAIQSFESAQTGFSDAAAALVEADVPEGGPFERPAIPASLATDADTIAETLDEVVAAYQTVMLDGAAAYVVYEDVCVTTTVPDAAAVVAPKTLAATGTSDGLALGTTAGLLLLVGAAVTTVTVRRRRSA